MTVGIPVSPVSLPRCPGARCPGAQVPRCPGARCPGAPQRVRAAARYGAESGGLSGRGSCRPRTMPEYSITLPPCP
ncbi:hypothetical protein GB881_00895 [Georgenia subflava]|uniref:Uncharacterized protein n=1 Tax=Georgenia subflava TaxID=1622177 RepID=A0A6N7EF93_9MICO|nr:hypothetical protein [Georgenia subflava]